MNLHQDIFCPECFALLYVSEIRGRYSVTHIKTDKPCSRVGSLTFPRSGEAKLAFIQLPAGHAICKDCGKTYNGWEPEIMRIKMFHLTPPEFRYKGSSGLMYAKGASVDTLKKIASTQPYICPSVTYLIAAQYTIFV